ncbi:hypothetical protein [uncultured Gimesia sp.]|uniref:hypothetical protein n=1 Tax=uncultured Gimesia sp. TaxID=1678688 RepID=UPI000E8AB2D8|nr:hypothetical protein [Planctomycetaceae bacterium]HBL48502.1 hypothetical protein [Planctomycetaceae bacterium]|tara:strand:- start:127 stop:363 length:237 start_codon:yes stop_codon:yes gene_type:complete
MAISECGEISQDACYTLAEFTSRTGLKRDALRAARRNGLRVVYKHNRAYIMGRDWLAYLDSSESDNTTPEKDNAPEAV